ncbi:MAG: hypothetical protein O2779_03530 [Nanoarchaeota archaeon]|nr:hypothetical protein [Nanoarchaeota archaeon]
MRYFIVGMLMVFIVACSPVARDVAVVPLEVVDSSLPVNTEIVEEVEIESDADAAAEIVEDLPVVDVASKLWMRHRFTDIRTGDTFSIDDFAGETVLFESFAVWCPKCTKQQHVFKEMEGDVIHISLDTDPNEDVAVVRDHITRNGFDWYYAISPAEVTKDLIDYFGITIVNAPAIPVVMVCSDGEARMLPNGHKDIEELEKEIGLGC